MAIEVLMPKIGFSMNEGTITEWLVEDGGAAMEGQPLFLLESDKSSVEVEAPGSGTLRIIMQAGETCEVGTLIGSIG